MGAASAAPPPAGKTAGEVPAAVGFADRFGADGDVVATADLSARRGFPAAAATRSVVPSRRLRGTLVAGRIGLPPLPGRGSATGRSVHSLPHQPPHQLPDRQVRIPEETERFLRPHRQVTRALRRRPRRARLEPPGEAARPRRRGQVMEPASAYQRQAMQPWPRPVPIVNLAEAREAALENARAVYLGHDPRQGSTTPSFDEAAEIVIKMHASTWRNPRTSDIWRSSFRRFVSPMIGASRSAPSPPLTFCPC